jgi:hypothetical protein
MAEQDDVFDAIAEFNRSYLTLAQRCCMRIAKSRNSSWACPTKSHRSSPD